MRRETVCGACTGAAAGRWAHRPAQGAGWWTSSSGGCTCAHVGAGVLCTRVYACAHDSCVRVRLPEFCMCACLVCMCVGVCSRVRMCVSLRVRTHALVCLSRSCVGARELCRAWRGLCCLEGHTISAAGGAFLKLPGSCALAWPMRMHLPSTCSCSRGSAHASTACPLAIQVQPCSCLIQTKEQALSKLTGVSHPWLTRG